MTKIILNIKINIFKFILLIVLTTFPIYQINAQNKISLLADGFGNLYDLGFNNKIFYQGHQRSDSCDFTVEAGENMKILMGERIQIKSIPVEGITYNWYPETGLSNPGIVNPVVSPEVTTTYFLTGVNKKGCKKIDSMVIEVLRAIDGIETPTRSVSIDSVFAYDRFGNSYTLNDLTQSQTPATSCNAGFFQLDFLDEPNTGFNDYTFGAQRRNVACQVFSDMSNLLLPALDPYTNTPTIPLVHIEIYGASSMPAGALGLATSYYIEPVGGATNGILDGEVWKSINGGYNSWAVSAPGNIYQGIVKINFLDLSIIWHDDLNTATAIGKYDLYTVILHELIHSLGFASLISSTGASRIQGTNYYSRYDTYLKAVISPTPTSLISTPGDCYNTQFNTNAANLIIPCGINSGNIFQGGDPQPIYSPTTYMDGSSLSHFDDDCGNLPYVMTWSQGTGPAYMKRHPLPQEVSALCDIGYNTSNVFGTATSGVGIYYNTYPLCPDRRIAGVDDKFYFNNPSNRYEVAMGGSIMINDVLQNDDDNGNIPPTFDCLTTIARSCIYPVMSQGTVSNTSGTSFTYTPDPNFVGEAILRYIPVSSTGKRGNITYININVVKTCPANSCDLICGGDLESISNCFAYPLSDFRITDGNSPDMFYDNMMFTGASNYGVGCSTDPIPYPHDYPAKHTFIGIAGFEGNNEGLFFKLNSPMLPGSSYNISFWANGKNNSCLSTIQLVGSTDRPCTPPNTISMNAPSNCGSYNFSPVQIANVPITINTWQQYSVTFIVPAVNNLNFLVLAPLQLNNAVWIDDISVHQILTVNAGPDVSIACSGSTQLNATVNTTAAVNYSWTPPTGLSCTNCPNPIANPLSTTTYTVTATDVNGCNSVSSSVVVDVSTAADLYIQDTPSDLGIEPNPDNGDMWVSEDIWVRNVNDGVLIHQNPISNVTNYVYVRVHNRGCLPTTGEYLLNLRWAKGSASLAWPNYWDGSIPNPQNTNLTMGNTIATLLITPPIPGGTSRDIPISWIPPDVSQYNANPVPGHFCLVARIESANDPMFSLETSDITGNVRNNNNIAWKNLDVVDSGKSSFNVGNSCSIVKVKKVQFNTTGNNQIYNKAIVKAKLSSALRQIWIAGGSQGSNIAVLPDSSIQLLSPGAFISNLTMNPCTFYSISLEFKRRPVALDSLPLLQEYIFDAVQFDGPLNNTEGGVRFSVILPPDFPTLNLKMFIQGFYNAAANVMVEDTVKIFVRNIFPPYSLVDSAKANIHSDGTARLIYTNPLDSVNYYIQLKHRNSIETWSKSALNFTSKYANYDFSTALNKAFGNNMIMVDSSPVRYAIYSGDVNQDGSIDLTDGSLIDNDASNFVSDYVATDLNGDGITDLSDAVFADNNSFNFISKITP